jgi:modulator of FtsH protease HflK
MGYGDNGWDQGGGGGEGPDLGKMAEEFSKALKGRLKYILVGIVAFILLIFAWSSVYKVNPGEIAVVRTFGKESGQHEQGLHFRVPLVQDVDIVNLEAVRRIEVGFRGNRSEETESLMLTGDENIVDARMIVQYRVKDPSLFLFELRNPEAVLRNTAEVALRGVVGRTTVLKLLTDGKAQVQSETRDLLKELMNRYQSGLEITEVKLQAVNPPEQVKEAFHDVVRAQEEKQKLINEAQAYEAEVVPKARGKSAQLQREAEAYKEQRVLRATGDADRFRSVVAEYKKAPRVTRERLYLETVERVLNSVPEKTIVDEKIAGGTVPLLRLGRTPQQ